MNMKAAWIIEQIFVKLYHLSSICGVLGTISDTDKDYIIFTTAL